MRCLNVLSVKEVRALENQWFEDFGSAKGLMQQAAWSVACKLRDLKEAPKTALVLTGPGNNGADGWLCALYLQQMGLSVCVEEVHAPMSQLCQWAKHYATSQSTLGFDPNQEVYDLCVDAVFGIGLSRGLEPEAFERMQRLSKACRITAALDVPSGLCADTGRLVGEYALKADYSFSLLALKAGLLTAKGVDYAGEVEQIELLPVLKSGFKYLEEASPVAVRQAYSSKGSFGHVLIVGGASGFGGAAMLSAVAALHAGAGKVSCALAPEYHAAMVGLAPEVMTLDLNQTDQIKALIPQVDSVALGMGLGRDKHAEALMSSFFELLIKEDTPLVLDADALYWLAGQSHKLSPATWITPHPGEAARLLGLNSAAEVEADRVGALGQLRKRYGAQVLLKGAGSLVSSDSSYLIEKGHPCLATAGSGDVLSGLAAALRARSNTSLQECAWFHAKAGKLAAANYSGAVTASVISSYLNQALNGDLVD